MYDLQASVYHAGRAIQMLVPLLSEVEQFVRETDAVATLGLALEGIKEELENVERELGRLPMRIGRQIEASTTRPTGDQLEAVERAWRDAPELIGRLNALILVRVPTFYSRINDALNEERFPTAPGEHVDPPRRGR